MQWTSLELSRAIGMVNTQIHSFLNQAAMKEPAFGPKLHLFQQWADATCDLFRVMVIDIAVRSKGLDEHIIAERNAEEAATKSAGLVPDCFFKGD